MDDNEPITEVNALPDNTSAIPVMVSPRTCWVNTKEALAQELNISLPKLDKCLAYASFPRYSINGVIWYSPANAAFWLANNQKASPKSDFRERFADPSLQEVKQVRVNVKGKKGFDIIDDKGNPYTINNHPDIVKERARYSKAWASLAELQYKVKSGKLIEAEKWQMDEATRYQIFKDTLMRLPNELACKVEGMKREPIEGIIKDTLSDKLQLLVKTIKEVPILEPLPENPEEALAEQDKEPSGTDK